MGFVPLKLIAKADGERSEFACDDQTPHKLAKNGLHVNWV
jgi:hypothetical protein